MKKLLFILLGFINLNAFAVDPTQGPLQQHPALCQYGYNPNCGQNSSPPPQKIIRYTTVYLPDKYGALAFSEKAGHISGSLNKDSLEEAKRTAKARCEEGSRGHPCKVITWVRNGCVAAAIGTLGKKTIVSKAAEEPGKAEDVALNRCRKTGAKYCEIYMPEGCSIP